MKVKKVSIGLTQEQDETIAKAIDIVLPPDRESSRGSYVRNFELRVWIDAVCRAINRAAAKTKGKHYLPPSPLAVTMRWETDAEMEERCPGLSKFGRAR
jgi:hypothetical protein